MNCNKDKKKKKKKEHWSCKPGVVSSILTGGLDRNPSSLCYYFFSYNMLPIIPLMSQQINGDTH